MRSTLTALLAIFALGVIVASSASAHPLFLTESGKELLFVGTNPAGTTPTLRGEHIGLLGSFTCQKVLIDGFASNKSTLAHRISIIFHGKCEFTVAGNKSNCGEPIVWKESLAELGLVLGKKTVGILLEPSDGTNTVARFPCGELFTTTFNGMVVGEIPEINNKLENQYNGERSESEQVFEAEGRNSKKQSIKAIELLGVNMTGVELEGEGVLGGEASVEMTLVLKGDGKIEICTKEPPACP